MFLWNYRVKKYYAKVSGHTVMVDRRWLCIPRCVHPLFSYLKTLPNYHRNHKRIKIRVCMTEPVLSPGRAINTGSEIQTNDCKLIATDFSLKIINILQKANITHSKNIRCGQEWHNWHCVKILYNYTEHFKGYRSTVYNKIIYISKWLI